MNRDDTKSVTDPPINQSDGSASSPSQAGPQNGTIRARSQVTVEGWAAMALTGWVLASALMSHASLTLLVFCMLLASLIIGAVQTQRNLRNIVATRRLPETAVAGRAFSVEIEVHNRRYFGTAQGILLTSEIRPAGPERPAKVFFHTIPAREHVTKHLHITLPARGLYRFGELNLASRFPFGFMERTMRLGSVQELLVYPRLGKLSRRFFEFERESHPHQAGRRPGPATLEADYHGLREFRDGDSPRWIHWATTARRGQVMVREYEARQNRDVLVLLDPWVPESAESRHLEFLELAISVVATVCVELCERQCVHLVLGIAANPPIVTHGESSPHFLRELLRQLALVAGTPTTQWDELLDELPVAWTNQMRITAVSPRPLDLANRLTASHGRPHRWQRLGTRLSELDVTRADLREFFELQ